MIRLLFKKMKLVHWLAVVVFILAVLLFISWRWGRDQSKNVRRLKNNAVTLTSEISYFRTRNGDLMYQTGVLALEKRELKRLYEGELADILKDMDVRLRRMESLSNTSTVSTHIIETTIKDSIVKIEGKEELLKVVDHKSKWLDFYQIQYKSYARTKIVKRDSLIQVVYQPVREGFFLLRPFKRKPPLEQRIHSADPNSIITYSRFIKPVKKRPAKQ